MTHNDDDHRQPMPSTSSSSSLSSRNSWDAHESHSMLARSLDPSSRSHTVSRSSPLNPNSAPISRHSSYIPSSSPPSFTSVMRLPSEESRAFSLYVPSHSSSTTTTRTPSPSSLASSPHRASMILYRLTPDSPSGSEFGLLPPRPIGSSSNRDSMVSSSGDSFVSLSSDSKYPTNGQRNGLIPYAYDPEDDDDPFGNTRDDADEGEDWAFEDKVIEKRWNEKKDNSGSSTPTSSTIQARDKPRPSSKLTYSTRGLINIGGLVILLIALLALFVAYPVVTFYRDDGRNALIAGNRRINSTGQAFTDVGDVVNGTKPGGQDFKLLGRRMEFRFAR